MTEPSYPTPPIHRASLEQRLRNICGSLGINELRTRTSLAHTVVAQMLPAGVVKGGAAIKLRVGDQASRLTTDLDAARAATHTVETYTAELSDRLSEGWHGFTGRLVDREPADPPDVPAEYVMQPFEVKLSFNGQSYVTVPLELGHDEVGSTDQPRLALDAGITEVFERLGFPTPAPVPVLAVEHQIAQKLHACTTPDRHGGNERPRPRRPPDPRRRRTTRPQRTRDGRTPTVRRSPRRAVAADRPGVARLGGPLRRCRRRTRRASPY
ncbi:MAG: nucleotidyl transferase AbiEii/AbiGii toxin family protein [Microthrixaceae bacterium]